MLYDVFDNRFVFDGLSTRPSKRTNFKPLLVKEYLGISEKFHKGMELECQILGNLEIKLPSFLVIGSHMFKHEWASDAQVILKFNNINNPRNGLLLFQPLEKAFDRSQLCFVKCLTNNDQFTLKLLDQNLRNRSLFEACVQYVTETSCATIDKTVEQVCTLLESRLRNKDGRPLMFNDVEGMSLICRGYIRPFKRCLNFHANRAHDYARKKVYTMVSVD